MTEPEVISFSSIDPPAHLPELAQVARLDEGRRRAALAQWVAWFNGHRSVVPPELERQLQRALTALDEGQVEMSSAEAERTQHDFDEWIRLLPEV